jgi:hypothetical protein
MVVSKMIAKVILAGKGASDFLARRIIAIKLFLLLERRMNVPIMPFEICWSLEGFVAGAGEYARESVFVMSMPSLYS